MYVCKTCLATCVCFPSGPRTLLLDLSISRSPIIPVPLVLYQGGPEIDTQLGLGWALKSQGFQGQSGLHCVLGSDPWVSLESLSPHLSRRTVVMALKGPCPSSFQCGLQSPDGAAEMHGSHTQSLCICSQGAGGNGHWSSDPGQGVHA